MKYLIVRHYALQFAHMEKLLHRVTVLESLAEYGKEAISSVRENVSRMAADACDTDPQSFRKFRNAMGQLAIDITRIGVSRLMEEVESNIFEQPAHSIQDKVPEAPKGERLVVWLIHPTNYRPDGTPRKFKRLILPANAIGQLKALLPDHIQDGETQVSIQTHVLEDGAQPFDIDAIERSMQGEDARGVVMFSGIQTNQWVRALHLADLCKERGIPVVAGGYHVRADLPITEKQAAKRGMSLAIGEAEAELSDGSPLLQTILKDAWNGTLQPLYRQQENPDIDDQILPDLIPEYQRRLMSPRMATLETSRGCPYPCKFCTIRTIGGTNVRTRNPEKMKAWIREKYEKQDIETIFITDDNFAKSKQRFEMLKILAELREEGVPVNAIIQVDTTSTLGREGERFVEACRKGGVFAVFLGIESVDPATLKALDKPQNHPDRYKDMIQTWHDNNIMTQCGFILGSGQDTPGVGRRSAKTLLDMGIDVASAYTLTPLPGSVDYHDFHNAGYVVEPDFNTYDSHSRAYLQFPGGLSPEQVMQEYRDFYDEFFDMRNLPHLAERLDGRTLIAAMRLWFVYKYAISRGDHPMYSGWGRLPPDYRRSDFDDEVPSIQDLAPRPDGVGSPSREKRKRGLAVAGEEH